MKSFTEILSELENQNTPEVISLKEKIKTQTFSKNTVLQRQGDLNKYAFYVKSGLLRSFTVDEKGKEHVFMFAPEGWLITDGSIDSERTILSIDALEDGEIEYISQDDFKDYFLPLTGPDDSERSESMMRRMAVMQKRIIMLISATAIERYENFIQTYPDIIQRVPQKMIASYLGITPEALSKVKGIRLRS